MKRLKLICLILIALIVTIGCSNNGDLDNVICGDENDDVILGTWGNARFVSGGSCYENECVEMNFELTSESTYQFNYSVNKTDMSGLIRELSEVGTYNFTCSKTGVFGGMHSGTTYLEGNLKLISDSSLMKEWFLRWNGVEGLIILPENIGFDHDSYIILEK